jgi:hypothetical protein
LLCPDGSLPPAIVLAVNLIGETALATMLGPHKIKHGETVCYIQTDGFAGKVLAGSVIFCAGAKIETR